MRQALTNAKPTAAPAIIGRASLIVMHRDRRMYEWDTVASAPLSTGPSRRGMGTPRPGEGMSTSRPRQDGGTAGVTARDRPVARSHDSYLRRSSEPTASGGRLLKTHRVEARDHSGVWHTDAAGDRLTSHYRGGALQTEPLTSWVCDHCGQLVETAAEGILIWGYEPGTYRSQNFRIVHKNGRGPGGCDPKGSAFPSSLDLDGLLGPEGQAHLLSFLSAGPLNGQSEPRVVNMDEFVDVFRRLQTPWYEEARQSFNDEDVVNDWAGSNEYHPYLPDSLRRIASSGT